jgi:hypothetical protein
MWIRYKNEIFNLKEANNLYKDALERGYLIGSRLQWSMNWTKKEDRDAAWDKIWAGLVEGKTTIEL